MKKPILNQEQRWLIINDTLEGAKLNVWLQIQKIKRDCNFVEWFLIRRALNKALKESVKFKGWD